jgi:hypothetical protein
MTAMNVELHHAAALARWQDLKLARAAEQRAPRRRLRRLLPR